MTISKSIWVPANMITLIRIDKQKVNGRKHFSFRFIAKLTSKIRYHSLLGMASLYLMTLYDAQTHDMEFKQSSAQCKCETALNQICELILERQGFLKSTTKLLQLIKLLSYTLRKEFRKVSLGLNPSLLNLLKTWALLNVINYASIKNDPLLTFTFK